MGPLTISFIGFSAILILAFLRFPLALSMGLVGVIGFGELTNYRAAISNIGRLVMDLGQSYSLSVLPLFILMGLLVEKGGMAKQLYRAAYAFLGDKKGGLAMSTVVACGMFSAISGSSIARNSKPNAHPKYPLLKIGNKSTIICSFLKNI